MMRYKLATMTALCAATGAFGHHGSTFFDGDTELRYEGVVIEFDYRNPHSWLYLGTTDESGDALEMAIEGQGSSLWPHGVTPISWLGRRGDLRSVNPNWTKPDAGLGDWSSRKTAPWCRWRGRPGRDNTGVTTARRHLLGHTKGSPHTFKRTGRGR